MPLRCDRAEENKAVIDGELCADCGACVDSRPTHAIEME